MARNEFEFGSAKNDLNDNQYWGELLNKTLPDTIDYTKIQCYGIIEDGKPVVAWSFNSFLLHSEHNVKEQEASVSIAAFRKDWKPLKVIRLILSLFFNNTCYNRLTAVTHPSNRQAVRLVKIAGFTLEGILRKPAKTENLMQFSILREDWKGGRFYG